MTTTPSLFAQLAKLGAREIVTFDGIKIEIVETSFADRTALAKIHDAAEGAVDTESVGVTFIRALLFACCYAPGTNDKVFASAEDVGALPIGLVLQIAEHAKRINGLTPKPEVTPDPDAEEAIHQPNEAEKNG